MASHDIIMAAAGAGGVGPEDTYFKNVSLLLTGNGSNGAQNNTFLDSSTNNFTITRNGNTTQGTFSPYGNLWSNYFNGSTDYIKNTSTGTTFQTGTGNFTIEFWANSKAPNPYGVIFELYEGLSGQLLDIQANSTGTAVSYVEAGTFKITTSVNPFDGTWHHHAIVRNGSTVTYYIDGTSAGTYSTTLNLTTGSSFIIGGYSQSSFYSFAGYISNFRFVKGTAVYTSSFTPSTAPLTAVSGTSLLTCQSNRFIDNSSNNFTITVNGNTSVQRFSPFNPASPYLSSTIGGSGYFDGTGDYLSVPSNSAFDFGTGNFTVEFWIYFNSLSVVQTIYDCNYGTAPNITFQTSGTSMTVYMNGTSVALTSSVADTAKTWIHYACVRNGTTVTLYRNGTSVASATYSGNVGNSSVATYIGGSTSGGGYYLNGYMSNHRVVKGTAVYTSAFTPPTFPVAAISGTSLLTNFTNAGIPDAAMMNDLETIGNTQVSTSAKKYGTGSIYFDGTGDTLKTSTASDFNGSVGNWTIEAWMYCTDSANNDSLITGNTNNFYIVWLGTTFYLGDGIQNPIAASGSKPVNQWFHVAVVKNGSTYTAYINGSSIGSTTTALSNTTLSTWTVGAYSGASAYMKGYIDDLRITKGYARYTASFTPPTEALPTY